MQKRSILVGLSLVAILVAGCGKNDHKGPFSNNSKKDGADIRIDKLGGMGSPLKQKVTINEGEMLAVHADVRNLGIVDAEDVRLNCVMRRTPKDNNTLTFEQELVGTLEPSKVHKQNIYIDGTAALEPGDYNLTCKTLTTSQDVNKDNDRRVIVVTIKGDSD